MYFLLKETFLVINYEIILLLGEYLNGHYAIYVRNSNHKNHKTKRSDY